MLAKASPHPAGQSRCLDPFDSPGVSAMPATSTDTSAEQKEDKFHPIALTGQLVAQDPDSVA